MIELKIDPEFRDLIPPLTEEEYKGLEESLIQNGFDETQPIILWKDHNTVVDGHNRYEICVKHNIEPVTLEREFESRYDVIKWMLDLQLNRRSPNKKKRTYVIGRRYLVEKRESAGNPNGFGSVNKTSQLPQNGVIGKMDSTSKIIGAQLGIGKNTVERAAEFTLAVDTIVRVTGIRVNDILDDKIKATMDDIKTFAELEEESQKKIMALVLSSKDDISTATDKYNRAEMERQIKEAELQKKQMEEKLRLEREEKAKQERERLRIEREEKEKVEKEKLAKARAEQERLRLEKVENERKIALENAKTAMEQERIRKEKEEQLRIEKEQLKKEREEQERLEKERLEKIRLEQEKKDEEELEKLRLEQERIDAEKIEEIEEFVETAKAEIIKTPYDPYLECSKFVMGSIDFDMWVSEKRKSEKLNYNLNAKRFDHENPEMFGRVWADILDAGKDTAKLTERVIESYTNKYIEEAFVIVKNETDTTWFMNLMYTASAVVFPVSAEKSQLKSHALVYFGKNIDKFMKYCEQFGWGVVLNK